MFWDFPPIFAHFLVNSCSNNKGKKLFCWCRRRLRQQTKGREPLASAVFPLHGMAQLDSALLASGTRYVAWNCRDIIVNAWFCKLTLFTVAIDGSLAACWEPRPRWCQKRTRHHRAEPYHAVEILDMTDGSWASAQFELQVMWHPLVHSQLLQKKHLIHFLSVIKSPEITLCFIRMWNIRSHKNEALKSSKSVNYQHHSIIFIHSFMYAGLQHRPAQPQKDCKGLKNMEASVCVQWAAFIGMNGAPSWEMVSSSLTASVVDQSLTV